MTLDATLARVTERIIERSRETRRAYLDAIAAQARRTPARGRLSCANQAHGFAACGQADKTALRTTGGADAPANVAIVTAYNDMLSAHQPYATYPARIKAALAEVGAVAQVAGGTPAMCDGITQGRPGMELSLFSRDVVAMSTAIALSHDTFDAALCLGVCDKIVPGMLMGALAFGHLPTIFVPGGPMTSGIPNPEKSRLRVLHANGVIDDDALLDAESRSYHAAGTCTFYGTANTNQLMMEFLGLHLPGASFVPSLHPLRDALTEAAARRVVEVTALGDDYRPVGEVIDERSIINAVVGILATGGSTNHTLHLVSIARAAGILIDWDDFDELSGVVPLLARLYPSGIADINHFHEAGGTGFVMHELLGAGLLHGDARTMFGDGGLAAVRARPALEGGELCWSKVSGNAGDASVLRPVRDPFQSSGGIRVVRGNLGRAVTKVSAVASKYRRVRAPALCFDSQDQLRSAFDRGELNRDFVAVVRGQGPRANGMPELHALMPPLIAVQDRGYQVALVTDGRLSGASGKVPAAIHVTPESADAGPLARVRDGDLIIFDADAGVLDAEVEADDWQRRTAVKPASDAWSTGRGMFSVLRGAAKSAELGGSALELGGPADAS